MKVPTGLLALTLLLAGAGTSHAEVRIARDQGGQIGRYVDRYEQLRASGQTIVIDGLCASACTIILAAIPHDKICVTPNANLAFHAAWDFGAHGHTVANPEATRTLYSMYPSQVRRWIASQGGLTPRMIFLRGRQLEAMYRPCY
jgi:ATP-dependent protease ClpP protease subunit